MGIKVVYTFRHARRKKIVRRIQTISARPFFSPQTPSSASMHALAMATSCSLLRMAAYNGAERLRDKTRAFLPAASPASPCWRPMALRNAPLSSPANQIETNRPGQSEN